MKNTMTPYLWKRLAFTAAPMLALLIAFGRWALFFAPENALSLWTAGILMFLFLLLGIRFIPIWMQSWTAPVEVNVHEKDGKRSNRTKALHPTLRILFYMILFRLALFLLAYAISYQADGYQGGVFDTIGIWNPVSFDGRHYLFIAENWYASSGNERFLLVFLPFYPIVVRLFNYIFQNYLVSGLFVSNLCCVFSGYIFYELALLDMDKRSALRALKYLCIFPAAYLLSAPLSDSLFLLLSLSAMYYARKKNYPLACFIGFFASFTRLLGVLLFAPICFELVSDIVREKRRGKLNQDQKITIATNALSLLIIPLGLGLYLIINDRVAGNPFQFLLYQAENWQQGPGWFFNTAGYQTDHALQAAREGNLDKLYGLWLPNLMALFLPLIAVICAVKKLRPSYTAYFILYYLISMGATWLLSAPRYMATLFPVPIALSALTKHKAADWALTLLCAMGLVFYLYAFIMRWSVY